MVEAGDSLGVFHRPSNQTQLLNPLTAIVFRALLSRDCTIDALLSRISEEAEVDPAFDLESWLSDVLEALAGFGYVERAAA